MSNLAVFMILFLYPFAPKHNPIMGIFTTGDRPVACYDLNQELTDVAGNFHLTGNALYTTGYLGNGALVSSTNILGSPQNGQLTPSQITLSLWLTSTVTSAANLVSVANGESWRLTLVDGDLYWSISGSDDELLVEGVPVVDGQWHHLIAWATGIELGVQIDGGIVLTQTQSLPIPNNSGSLVVGELSNGDSIAHLDSVKIWDRDLSQTERLADYNVGIGVSCEEIFAPTAVSLVSIDLPSGGRGEFEMSMSAGEAIVAVGVLALSLVTMFDLLRRMARSGSL